MEIKTKTQGIVNVEEDKIVEFPEGLVGFEEYKKYAIFPSEYEPFLWLQSLDRQNLAFLLVDPFLICPGYEANIDDTELNSIDVKNDEDIIIMTIVTVPNDGGPITANFLGPVVINKENNRCIQVVLNDNRWTTKFNILEALKRKGE
ncbi:MAG: flagellar assembly protein FliW [Treponema sp.]